MGQEPTNQLGCGLIRDPELGHEGRGIVDVWGLHDDRERCNDQQGPARWGQLW